MPRRGEPFFKCSTCGQDKILTAFKRRPNGRPQASCISCVKEAMKKAALRHRKGIKLKPKDDPNSEQFKCGRCQQMLPKENFHKNAARHRGYDGRCKDCLKETRKGHHLKVAFGITNEDYERMLEKQNGVCFICKEPETMVHLGRTPRLSVDHCHRTDKVRTLLCNSCNHLVGFIERRGNELVHKAMEYVKRHS